MTEVVEAAVPHAITLVKSLLAEIIKQDDTNPNLVEQSFIAGKDG